MPHTKMSSNQTDYSSVFNEYSDIPIRRDSI